MNRELLVLFFSMVAVLLLIVVSLFMGAKLEQILLFVLTVFLGVLFLWKRIGGKKL